MIAGDSDLALFSETCVAIGIDAAAILAAQDPLAATRAAVKQAFPTAEVIYRFGVAPMWGGKIGDVECWHSSPELALILAATRKR